MIVDKKYKHLLKSSWIDDRGYIRIYVDGKNQALRLHRHILNLEGIKITGKEVDHINGNKIDNRLKNLRICNRSQNMRNQSRPNKGVRKMLKKWQARISVNKKCIHLGSFETKKEALLAYDKASKKYHKQYGVQNG